MHGLRLREDAPKAPRGSPVSMFNSVTMLGAEVHGRSYGGGILKMEPREAASLPVPGRGPGAGLGNAQAAGSAGSDTSLRNGQWTNVVKTVDEVLLVETLGLSRADVVDLHDAARTLRSRRMGKGSD